MLQRMEQKLEGLGGRSVLLDAERDDFSGTTNSSMSSTLRAEKKDSGSGVKHAMASSSEEHEYSNIATDFQCDAREQECGGLDDDFY